MKIPSFDTRRIWLALCTMLAIGALFSWYFLLHVPGKEAELIDKKYRALRRIGQNLVQMRSDCISAISQELDSWEWQQKSVNSIPCEELYRQFQDAFDEQAEKPGRANSKRLDQLEKLVLDCQEQADQSFNATLSKLKVKPAYSYMVNDNVSDDFEYVYFNDLGYKMHLDDFINNTQLIDEYFDRFVIVRLYRESAADDTVIQRIAYQGTKYKSNLGAYSRITLQELRPVMADPGVTKTVNVAGQEYRAFSHTIATEDNEDWILCGLESEKDIKSESRNIQMIAIIFLVLAFLFLLLAMPVIKLMVMSSIERLDGSNVFYLGLSLIVGTAVAFLILLVSHHFITYQAGYKIRLRTISSRIDANFKKEIDDITAQLDSFSARGWQIDSSGAYVLDPLGLDSFKRHRYPFYNEAIALNHQGDALITRATHPLAKLPNVPNIKTREYFSEANAGSRAYALQSILSRNTLRHEAGIGIRARDSLYVTWQAPTEPSNTRGKVSVVAIATKLKSVMDPLLPPAFSFCMIDERGEVLFHSSKLKNLQENLFHETENDLLLDAAVKGRLAIEMSLSYGGKDYAAFAKPVQGQPLYLVTLFDKDYYHVRVILTLSLALLLTFAHFALQGLQLLLLYLTTYRSSKLKLKQFFLFWGRPRVYEPVAHPPAQRAANWKDKLGQMTFRERYNAALASMAIIALTLAVAASLFDKLSIMFTLAFMTVPIHLTTFHYMIFSHDQYGHDARRKKFFLIASAILLSFILGLGLACLNSGAFVALLITQAMIFGTYAINLFHNGVRKLHKIFDPLKPIHRYAIFVFGWLVMISVLPISFYYKVAFDRETQGFERYIQWESNTLMAKRNQLLEEEARQLWAVNNRAGIDQQELMEAYVADANKYGSYFDPAIPGLDKKSFERLSTTPLDSIEFYFRPPVRGPIENSRKILLGNAHDRPLKWFLKRPGTLLLESEDKSIAMSSVVPGFSLLAAKYFLVMVVILAVMFAVVYKIILSGMKYIFGIGRLSSARPAEVEAKKILNALIRPDSKFRIFLIGLPFSGKTGLARQIQQQLRTSDQQDQATAAGLALLANKKEIDFRHYEKDLMLSGKEKLFILKHFEHELNDHSKNEDKLAVLEELQRHDEVKIMISSAVEPDLVIEIYEKKIARLEAEKSERPDDPIRKELSDYRTAFRKWKNLLGGFKILHLPVKSTEIGTPLESELGYGTYLPRLVDYFDKTGDLTEDKILEIGEIASPYYHALWNSFSQHEKRILFDLAKDGFVNTRDITKIRLLIKKGIVVMEDCPRIMNRSFGHFILSVVKEDEELAMNEEVRRKGTWHAVQLVLVITLVSIIVFVAFVQREMIPNLNVTIGAISGLVALLSGFQRMIQAKS